MSVLEASDITIALGGHSVIADADVTLPAGTVTAIIGPNGAGKSTLLAGLAGLLPLAEGSVKVGGYDALAQSATELAKYRVMMAQDFTVTFPFTVREVVEMGRTPWRKTQTDHGAAVDQALDLTGMTELENRDVTTLSGGERQRTALARILAQAHPAQRGTALLLDEPTAAMDVAHAEKTLALMRTLAERGAAVGVVLHDLDAAVAYADRLVLIHHGRIQSQGPVEQVCDAGTLSTVYGTELEVFETGGRLRISPVRPPRVSAAAR